MTEETRFYAPLIVIDGNEYTGKSTLATEVVGKLRGEGLEVVHTREPGGTEFGEMLRDVLLAKRDTPLSPVTELLLHSAIRKEHVEKVIQPALLAGKIVVCERFFLSTLALNVYPFLETHPEVYKVFMDTMPAVVGGIPEPLTILLDLPEEKRLARGADRVKDQYESRSPAQLDATVNAYLQLQNSPTCITLNADAALEDLTNAVVAQIHSQMAQIKEQHTEADNAFAASEVTTTGVADDAPVVEEPVAEPVPFVLEEVLEEWLTLNVNASLFNDNPLAVEQYMPLARTYVLSLWNLAKDPALFEGGNASRMRRELHSRLHYGYQLDLLRVATYPVTEVETPVSAAQ